MNWFYRYCLRPALFFQGPEEIHHQTLHALRWASRSPLLCEFISSFCGSAMLQTRLLGLSFPNPIGLAAGMDKEAVALPAWGALGFGFTEIGTVTQHRQPGNPEPRLFRLLEDQALINRMGFNNPGAEAVAQQLARWQQVGRWPEHPVGINLGKSKVTPLANAAQDYAHSFRQLQPYGDFFVINVSSPNTPNLRELQEKSALDEILAAVQELNVSPSPQAAPAQASPATTAHSALPAPRPVLVKVAPDLTFDALDDILELVESRRIAGLVATNTTIARPDSDTPDRQRLYAEAGGLSGPPLRARSTEVIRHLYRQTRGQLPLIGVGGITQANDAWEKICAGASLLQLYTGLVFEGPTVVGEIVQSLQQRLEQAGMKSIQEAVGTHPKGAPHPET